jgi:Flp pilus assembly protein TadB
MDVGSSRPRARTQEGPEVSDKFVDQVDHVPTTRTDAGESMTSGIDAPALVLVVVSVVAIVVALVALATGHLLIVALGVALAVLTGALGMSLFALTHQRIRNVERHWFAVHPGVPGQPPTV